MPKTSLDDMLHDESSKPVIRRGQGVRLSTENRDTDIAESQNRRTAKSQVDGSKRVNRGYMLREDLIVACKQLALSNGRKLYEVMEDAIVEYLDRHGRNQ